MKGIELRSQGLPVRELPICLKSLVTAQVNTLKMQVVCVEKKMYGGSGKCL